MARDLKNKTVMITGGAVGIGFEIADKYLSKDANIVILVDVEEEQGKQSAATLTAKYGPGKAAFYKCDVTKDLDEVFTKIITSYKAVDVLVNNAGILNDTALKKTIEINVTALIEWSLKYYEHMRKDKGGKGGTIINLASIYGFRIDPFLPIYQASKFAVQGFTKSLGHKYNFERSGVRVLAINPGFTETKLTADPQAWDDDVLFLKDLQNFLKAQPWQKVNSVSMTAVEIFENAESGTAWLIEGAKTITEV